MLGLRRHETERPLAVNRELQPFRDSCRQPGIERVLAVASIDTKQVRPDDRYTLSVFNIEQQRIPERVLLALPLVFLLLFVSGSLSDGVPRNDILNRHRRAVAQYRRTAHGQLECWLLIPVVGPHSQPLIEKGHHGRDGNEAIRPGISLQALSDSSAESAATLAIVEGALINRAGTEKADAVRQ